MISFIAPHSCVGCQKEGRLLCVECELQRFPALPERCYRCHRLSRDSRVCRTCVRSSRLRHVWVRTAYEGAAKDLVYKLKFDRANKAAQPIASLIEEILPYAPAQAVLVPVPTASVRVRMRGYDHTALIARSLSRKRGLPYVTALRRQGSARQVGAERSVRLSQLEGAFYCPKPELVAGKDVVLVDDIVTTGGSIEQAAKVLRKSGARSVSAAIFAQKQ